MNSDISKQVVLASASLRRVQILESLGVSFLQQPVDIDESVLAKEAPERYVQRLAQEKAKAAQHQAAGQSSLVVYIGADTTVSIDQQCLGKPLDEQDFINMMLTLSGRKHEVLSAVCFLEGHQQQTLISSSLVYFSTLHLEQIQAYWRTGEPQGKAGGYAIQGIGATFVERIEGSHSGIVGLPIYETSQLLSKFDVPWVLSV